MAKAADIRARLHAVGMIVVQRPGDATWSGFHERMPEIIAWHLHDRWMRGELAAGWRHGPSRDDRSMSDPDLQSWYELSEARQDRDREAARTLLQDLDDAGYQLVALPPSG
jgi:hypothetical protein